MNLKINTKAFTIVELVVTILIVAAMAGFALPRYIKTVERSHESETMMQLRAIHAQSHVYKSRTGSFWPSDNGNDIDDINTELNLSIVPNGMTYNCDGDGTNFSCTATRNAPASSFTMSVDDGDLAADNPCCSAGACPGVAPAC